MEKIKELRGKFKTFAKRGWMCEGSDVFGFEHNVFFNNDTDEMFYADYDGNILDSNVKSESLDNIKLMAKIEGEIMKIARM